jgi:hypothetical protein
MGRVGSILLPDPATARIEEIEANGLILDDFHISRDRQRELEVSGATNTTIKKLQLCFVKDIGGMTDEMLPHVKNITWFLQRLSILQHLELDFEFPDDAHLELELEDLDLGAMRHLRLHHLFTHMGSLRDLLKSGIQGLQTLKLEQVYLAGEDGEHWADVFDELQRCQPGISDVSGFLGLDYIHGGDLTEEDIASWKSLCKCIQVRRQRRGLPEMHMPEYVPSYFSVEDL